MRVVICWSGISGYMAAAWRALAAVPGVSLLVVAHRSDGVAPFDAGVMHGIDYRLLDPAERRDGALVRRIVADHRPDVLGINAWNHPAYREVAAAPELAGVPKMLFMDTALRMDLRQAIGRRLLRPYLRRFDRVAVPGERAAMYARYLGFSGGQIRRGMYGIDFAAFAPCLADRLAAGPWPRAFLYAGRYAAEKRIDVLVDAYQRYRAAAAGADAWPLLCCGVGPEAGRLRGPGVTDLGFVQPERQREVFAAAGAFVIASAFEPWGVALAEAAAAGLPLLATDACGATVELLRDRYNGALVPTADPAALAEGMSRLTREDLPQWGTRSRVFAEAFDAATWPARLFDGWLPA